MTRRAEPITIVFDGEPGVWAPCSLEAFWDESDHARHTWTPERVRDWFRKSGPELGLLGRLLLEHAPSPISSALGPGAMRFVVRNGLLYPLWCAFSKADLDKLEERNLPADCRLEAREHCVLLLFEDPDPVSLAEPLDLLECETFLDDVHCYPDFRKQFDRKPQRQLRATHGADGHV